MRRGLLLAILLVGLSLRVIGADWGFPFLLHPDESVVANIPADMAKRASLDPAEYNHPDHIDIYANAAIYHAASHLVYHKPLAETFSEHPLLFYRLSRILVALLGTACILAAYLVGREYSHKMALSAALLVALFPSYVRHSHYITSDIPLTLSTLCVILFTIRYLKEPVNRNLWLASFCTAVSVSVKYPGVLASLVVAAVVIAAHYGNWQLVAKRLGSALAAFLVSLFLISPYLFLSFGKVVEGLTKNAFPEHLGADGLGWGGNLWFYLTSYLENAGLPLVAFSLAGAYLLVRREKLLAMPLFFGLGYWVALSKLGLHWERWALPMYSFPLLASAYGMAHLLESDWLARRRLTAPAWLTAVLVVCFPRLVASSVITANFTLKDTQYAAYQFAEKRGITQKDALYEGYTPFTPGGLGYGSILNAFGYAIKERRSFEYVMLSSDMYGRYLAEPDKYPREVEFYGRLFKLPQVARFAPPEYGEHESAGIFQSSELGKGLAFLADYTRRRESLNTGPTIVIYHCGADCFLKQEMAAVLSQSK